MRCFISINLPETLRKDIHGAIEVMKKGNADVKWVPADNLHITLKFLGNTDEDIARQLEGRLSALAGSHHSFRINLRGIGVFPDSKRPRVVWIGLLDTEALRKLQRDVEQTAGTAGFADEDRPFSPHLTIGRIRSSAGKSYLIKSVEALKERDFGNIEVNTFSLMKSDLKPTGAQYTTLAEFHLKRRSNDQ
ncbi:MAG TPA: RNA 2',3'-cyclic phosphodiesterase [Thermodesulfovibrionales bacterium]|nr:RNA 2',3'-cyclic phosphodiesterase [Thermodesulfovibrionales bacterium]